MVRTRARRSKKKVTKKAKVRTFDLGDVEVGGRRKVPNDQDYHFAVKKATEEEGDAGPYYQLVVEVIKGKYKGFRDWVRLSHSKKALWKLKAFLEACGVDTSGKIKLSPKRFLGLEFGGSVEDEEYKGKTRSRVVDFFPVDELEEEESDDEEEEDEGDEEEEEDDEEEEEVDDEDEEED